FFPEEYTDAGVWPENGILYRLAKRVERWLLRQADGFVLLTNKARDILFDGRERRPVEVIPCCVDMERFQCANDENRTKFREEFGLEDRLIAAYVGAFGGWYLTDETADLLGVLKMRRPDTFALVLTQSDPETIETLLHERGYSDDDLLVRRVSAAEVPKYLAAADLAVSFIKRCYSKQASSPTKNAEYLACGLPIIANSGIGDVDELIGGSEVGTLVSVLSRSGYETAVDEILRFKKPPSHMRDVAAREFELQSVGGARYRRLYSRLAG
ncbi:MAG TPA: glycosyltransferase, partial [Pyrinomonadaceae bacterium]